MTNERTVSFGNNDWRDLLTSELKRTGGDPSQLFELLEDIINERAWEKLLDTDGQPVGTFRRLIEAKPPVGCGQNVEKVRKLLDIEHRYERDDNDWHERMTILRQAVRELLDGGVEPIAGHGEIGRGRDRVRITNSKSGTDDATYTLRRLKRDAPELADKVINGELSANQAAIEAGFRARKVAVNMDDPESAARTIARYMDQDSITHLIDLLQNALYQDQD